MEGAANGGGPIRPKAVSARVHEITRSPSYQDAGFLRTDYHDIEDYCQVHIVFEDRMVADVFALEIVLGGVYNYLEVFANNHRTRWHMGSNNSMELYNPKEENLADVYIM